MAYLSALSIASLSLAMVAGCAAPSVDGAEDLDTSSPPAAHRDATPAPAPTGSQVPTTAAPPTAPSAKDPAAAKCPELGISGAFMCDGFESTALATAWLKVVVAGDVDGFSSKRAAAGTHSLAAAFAPLPSSGRAALSYHGAFAASPKPHSVAMQFSVYLPKDGYPTALPLGGFHGASGDLTVSMNNSSQIVLSDKLAGGTKLHALGASALGTWQCIEIQIADSGALDAWLGKTHALHGTLASGPSSFTSVDAVEIGLSYVGGANANASVVGFYDDVVVAPAAVGCLH